jgi:hypothetical protein
MDYHASQIPENLIFGSYETNGLMIRSDRCLPSTSLKLLTYPYRFETAFQSLFRLEAALRKSSGDGLITTNYGSTEIKGLLHTSQDFRKTQNREADASIENVPRDETVSVPLWFMYNMKYEMTLQFDGASRLLGSRAPYATRFFPFQRPFYTDVEARTDEELLASHYRDAVEKASKKLSAGTRRMVQAASAFVSKPVAQVVAQDKRAESPGPGEDSNGEIVLNHLSAILLASISNPPFTADNAINGSFVSSAAPSKLAHAKVWQEACEGSPVVIATARIEDPSIVLMDSAGHISDIPLATVLAGTALRLRDIPSKTKIRRLSHRPVDDRVNPFRNTSGLPGAPQLERNTLDKITGADVPPGFVLSGTISVFGVVPGKLYTFQGTASGGGVHEIVTLAEDTTLGALLTELGELDIGGIKLHNTQFEYTDEISAPANKLPGLWFEADVTLEGILQPVADLLKSIFNQPDPELHVECFLGFDRDWAQLIMPTGVTMAGTFEGISAKFGDQLTLKSCGVNICVISQVDDVPTYREFHSLHYYFTGTGLLGLPGSVAPLAVNLNLTVEQQLVTLLMDLDDWDDAFGVRGLTVIEIPPPPHTYCWVQECIS